MKGISANPLKQWQFKIFMLCWLAYAFVYFGRVNISISMLSLQTFFGTDKATVGILGSIFFYTYAVGQLLNGTISDKVSSRWFIFIGLMITGCSNILFSLSTNFTLSMVLWGCNGIGQSMLWASIVKTAGLWFQPKQYTKVMVGLNTSMVLGYVLAWGGSGFILRSLPWQNVFLIPGAVLVTFSVLWLVMARNSPKDVGLQLPYENDGTENKTGTGEMIGISWKQLFFATGLIFVVVACIAQGMVKEGLGIWAPSLIIQMYHVDMSDASFYILSIPIMNLLGILLAGVLNTWCRQQEKLTIILLLSAATVVFVLLWLFALYSIVIGILGIGVASGIMYGANTMLLGVLPIQYSQYGRAAFVTGFLDFCSYAGAGLSSVLIGKLLDTHPEVTDVFKIWVGISAIAIASLAVSVLIKGKEKNRV